MSLNQIRTRHGDQGLINYVSAYGKKGAITDDTQMTLFTAEGFILSRVRDEYARKDYTILAVYHALLRWLYTQDVQRQGQLIKNFGTCSIVDGILTGHKELFSQRAPGNSCLSALRTGRMGTMKNPINDSKGCGGVMRSAPVGLFHRDAEKAFHMGCRCAAITHGHPTGYLSSGFLAALISQTISGATLMSAIHESARILKNYPHHKECLVAIEEAITLSNQSKPSPGVIEDLGAGWIAEEALAISLYCALVAGDDFRQGALLAINHSGDSDSTGSITGNILGAIHGISIIPEEWLAELELKEVIEELAVDLYHPFSND
jgi:ADP-ribosylglycohydrolase